MSNVVLGQQIEKLHQLSQKQLDLINDHVKHSEMVKKNITCKHLLVGLLSTSEDMKVEIQALKEEIKKIQYSSLIPPRATVKDWSHSLFFS